MDIESLSTKLSTKLPSESVELMSAIVSQKEWLCYQYSKNSLTLYLIRRYLSAHARMPGLITPTICGAENPLAIIRYITLTSTLVEGAIFLNGAVVRMSYKDTEDYFLFISREDAVFWDYPIDEDNSSVST